MSWNTTPSGGPQWTQPAPNLYDGVPGMAPPADGTRHGGRRSFRWLGALIPIIAVAALVFVVPTAITSSDADVEVVSTVGMIRGTDTIVVPYHRDGMVRLPFDSDIFQIRVAAIDVATSDLLWDVQLNDDLVGAVGVLAADEAYTYVASDHGLTILDSGTGKTVAGPEEISGLGEDYMGAYAAYAYDPRIDAVVALTNVGDYMSIPVGSAEAEPADEETAASWQGSLLDDSGAWMYLDGYDEVASGITMGDGTTMQIDAPPYGTQASSVTVTPEGGQAVTLPGPYFEAGFVLAVDKLPQPLVSAEEAESLDQTSNGMYIQPTVVTTGTGQVLLVAAAGGNSESQVLYLLGPDGSISEGTDVGRQVSRAVTADSGRVVLLTGDGEAWDPRELTIIAPDGGITQRPVGETTFWGSPR